MYHPTTEFLGRSWSTFTLLLMLGIALSMAWMLLRARLGTRTATLDACLLALMGGVFIGRLGHVLLNWAYFRDHSDEIIRIYWQGGLSVHGVLIGAWWGMWMGARWRKLDFSHVLDSATLVIPLLALLGWWGCAANACAYGAPVEHMADYPRLLTWVAPDIYGIVEPRFATQRLGILLSAALLCITALLFWRGWLLRKRFLVIVILSMITFTGLDTTYLHDAKLHKNGSVTGWLSIAMLLLCVFFLVREALSQTKN